MTVANRIDIRRIARAVSCVENRSAGFESLLGDAYRAARHVPVIGVTGPPGAGKSTLVDRLALEWAGRGEAVAILAVDPSSPYTGGAILGDRVRMQGAAEHERIFVRSLSSRGQRGGLSRAAVDVVAVMGSMGFDRVLLETVGAGQSDIDVGDVADAVVVLAVPGLGDHVQAAKAGILEIGDVFAVNKSDLAGAATALAELEASLDLVYHGSPGSNARLAGAHARALPGGNAVLHARHGDPVQDDVHWRPPVIATSARDGAGVPPLAAAIDDFVGWLYDTGRRERRLAQRLESRIVRTLEARLVERCLARAGAAGDDPTALSRAVLRGETTPDAAVDRLIDAALFHC